MPGSRVVELVSSVRGSSLDVSGVSEEFLQYHSQINESIAGARADGTVNQYFLAFNRFSKFCVKNCVTSLPSHPEVIMTYFLFLASFAKTASPILMARSAIRHYNLLYRPDLSSPTDRVDVGLVVNSIERRFAHPVKKSAPMTLSIMRKMIDLILNGDQLKTSGFSTSLADWQVVVKSIVKFHTFARFEEVIELKRSNFIFLDNGDCKIQIEKSKNNQFHDAKSVTLAANSNCLKYCPVHIVRVYFALLDSKLDFYFIPKIVKSQIFLLEQAEYKYCLKRFRSILFQIGVENWMDFGEHSDRIGGLSTAANAGCSISDLQVHGRWNTDNVPKMYHKRSMQCKRKISNVLNNL